MNNIRYDGKKLKNKDELVSLYHLRKLARFFKSGSRRKIKRWLNVLGKSTGHPKSFDEHELGVLAGVRQTMIVTSFFTLYGDSKVDDTF
jgi:hypothetical protein